jgi:hypothetical protein
VTTVTPHSYALESRYEIHLSEGTVRNYLSEAISKLGAGNRVEAARIARQRGGCSWLYFRERMYPT